MADSPAVGRFQGAPVNFAATATKIQAPQSVVYQKWTEFDAFPHFMRGQNAPLPERGSRMTWRIDIGLEAAAWDGEVMDEMRGSHIAWGTSRGRPCPNSGCVRFHQADKTTTFVTVELEFESLPGNATNFLSRLLFRVGQELARFRQMVQNPVAQTVISAA